MVEKYGDFSTVNMDIGEQFLTEVLKRTKEILNHVTRQNGTMLYEALKVFFRFFAEKKEGLSPHEEDYEVENYEITSDGLCKMLEFLKLPNDMNAPLIEEVIEDVYKNDKELKMTYDFEPFIDLLEKYEIVQNLELSQYEKESTFVMQFLLRVLYEVNMCDIRKNHKHFDERSFIVNEPPMDDGDHDQAIDKTVEVEENAEFWITDVNDMLHPVSDGYYNVFSTHFSFGEQKVLYFE